MKLYFRSVNYIFFKAALKSPIFNKKFVAVYAHLNSCSILVFSKIEFTFCFLWEKTLNWGGRGVFCSIRLFGWKDIIWFLWSLFLRIVRESSTVHPFQIRKVQDDLSSPSAILLIALPASYTCLSPTSLSTEVLLKVEKCCVVRSVVISRRDAVEDVENIWWRTKLVCLEISFATFCSCSFDKGVPRLWLKNR